MMSLLERSDRGSAKSFPVSACLLAYIATSALAIHFAGGYEYSEQHTPELAGEILWSQLRTVTKTATVSLHGNTYQVEPALAGRKVELVFSPFNLEQIEVRHGGRSYGPAVPHVITRHAHPKARPETPEPAPAPATGIAYLQLVADTHHAQVADDERIGFHALYSTPPDQRLEQIPGQMSIDDLIDDPGIGRPEQEAGR